MPSKVINYYVKQTFDSLLSPHFPSDLSSYFSSDIAVICMLKVCFLC